MCVCVFGVCSFISYNGGAAERSSYGCVCFVVVVCMASLHKQGSSAGRAPKRQGRTRDQRSYVYIKGSKSGCADVGRGAFTIKLDSSKRRK